MTIPTVFFYLPENDDVYFDAPLVLAEGLKELGIPFVANRDYWRLHPDSPETLFRRAERMSHEDADIVVIHDDWFYHYPQSTLRIEERPAPPGLFVAHKRYRLVYLDTWVGARTNSWNPEFRHCDLILRTQFNCRTSYPSNIRPWVLGFTERTLRACGEPKQFAERRRVLVENFAYTHPFPHGVREIFEREIVPKLPDGLRVDRGRSASNAESLSPYDRLMWQQSLDKHNPDYFQRLGDSMLVAAFCGYLAPAWPADASVHFRGEKRFQVWSAVTRVLSTLARSPSRLIQWDSWRFWEALCAGAVPLHLDLERYGAELPVMPENGRHYLGFDPDRPEMFLEALRAEESELSSIAKAGRDWALKYYSPRSMAARFLEMTGFRAAGEIE